MATMQFNLVSPERMLASMEVTAVEVPGAEGDLEVMPGHEPVITTLRPGVLRAHGAGSKKSFLVTGGFAQISGDEISVLAERAVPIEEATGTIIDEMLEEAKSLADAALPEDKDAAHKLMNDVESLRGTMAI